MPHTSTMSQLVTCPLCSISLVSIRSYISHIRLCHYKDTDFELTCGISDCVAVFSTFGAFNSHVYRHHRDILRLTVNTVPSSSTIHSTVDISDTNDSPDHYTELDQPPTNYNMTAATFCQVSIKALTNIIIYRKLPYQKL